MKEKECKEGIHEKVILDKWLLPVSNINAANPYDGHLVGKAPNMIPLDTSLFRELYLCTNYDILITPHLPECDFRKPESEGTKLACRQ